MIGFNGIVCVLLHDMARGGQQLIEHSRVGRLLGSNNLSQLLTCRFVSGE
jgi:hypothetical protein